jgi:hypothetical protein
MSKVINSMYDFTTPNLVALAVNLCRVFEIATIGKHTVKIIPSEHCSPQDIDLLYDYYGFNQSETPDMLVELMYSTNDVLNVFKSSGCETLEQIKERLPVQVPFVADILDSVSMQLLKTAIDRLKLGANDVIKIHALAKTIAQLAACDKIKVEHVAEAIQYRSVKLN